jgi:hypothetical protein
VLRGDKAVEVERVGLLVPAACLRHNCYRSLME